LHHPRTIDPLGVDIISVEPAALILPCDDGTSEAVAYNGWMVLP
jgi:hypothetical protein